MQDAFDPRPTTLTGRRVRLEPLGLGHAAELLDAGSDEAVWRYLPCPAPTKPAEMEAIVDEALRERDVGAQIPFAIVSVAERRAVGSTRYLDIQRENRAMEIGWTWIGRPWQRTAVNTEAKLLLLRHAFEDLCALRVQLKTDGRNEQSQAAIERIGARREGTLRRNRQLWDGFVRDTIVFSILDSEWPEVEAALAARLERGT